jgi:hypothetical protein
MIARAGTDGSGPPTLRRAEQPLRTQGGRVVPATAAAFVATMLAALFVGTPAAAGVSTGFPDTLIVVAPGDTFTLSLQVLEGGDAFNAFDASIRFDPSRVAFVPTSPTANQRGPLMTGACTNTFHLFTPTPDSLRITLSLLCSGVTVTGPGEIYRVRFRALETTGLTPIELGPFTRFFNAGFAVNPLAKRGMRVQIGTSTDVGPGAGGPIGVSAPWPNPSSGRGAVALRLESPGETQLELLDLAGRVRLRQTWSLGAGEQRLEWNAGDLEPGLYFVWVRSREGPAVVRRWTVVR